MSAPDLPGPRIQPDDPMTEAGRRILAHHLTIMRANEAGTRAGVDPEALHDMRVASRRMRAAFRLFEEYYEKQTVRRLRKGLKQTGRALGGVRDLDVLGAQVRAYRATLPKEQRKDLGVLLTGIKDQRERARTAMFATLGSSEHREWLDTMQTFVETEGMGDRQPSSPAAPVPCLVKELVPELVYRHFKQVRAYSATLNQGDIPHLHALRIDVKRFRYTLEFFQEVLGPEATVVIARAIGVQDHLGDLHDMDVARIFVEGMTEDSAITIEADLAALRAYLGFLNEAIRTNLDNVPVAWDAFLQADTRKKLAAAVGIL